jgi:MFS family permease
MFRIFLAPAELSTDDRILLLLLAAAFFVGQYDMTVLGLALPDIQRSFAIPEADLGQVIAAARIGALPAIVMALLADRVGRRSLLMFTLLGASIATGATGFARTAQEFMVLQFFARAFVTAEEIIAVVYVLEMLPARHRGWGVGFLAAVGAMGSGLASILYAVVEYLPGEWRALYVVAAFPMLYFAWMRRRLPESTLFQEHVDNRTMPQFWQPFKEIFLYHRRAIVSLTIIVCAFWFHLSSTMNFMSKYLQDTHGFAPRDVSILFIVAGSVAILGNTVAGRMSDHIGRRPTLIAALLLNCVATVIFYNSGGWILPLAWIGTLFGYFAVEVVVNATSGELFPTSCRSTASTLRAAVAMFAAVAGLTIEGQLYEHLGSHERALTLMSLSSLLAIPVVALLLRETSHTELR